MLRKMGADTITVKKLFASSIDSYKRKTQIVAEAEIHRKCAIAPCDFYADDLRIVAPQAADEDNEPPTTALAPTPDAL